MFCFWHHVAIHVLPMGSYQQPLSKHFAHVVFHKWVPPLCLCWPQSGAYVLPEFFFPSLLYQCSITQLPSPSQHIIIELAGSVQSVVNSSRWPTSNINDNEHHYPCRTKQNRRLSTVLRGHCAYHWLAIKTQPALLRLPFSFTSIIYHNTSFRTAWFSSDLGFTHHNKNRTGTQSQTLCWTSWCWLVTLLLFSFTQYVLKLSKLHSTILW